ncbi:MAG: triosephosphate isomerase (TIM) [Parcubacteria group bacterium LiPW_41]|nr:MAG: triosephosphate isomerase (TIM) [Parcubacteria group bacterium LiPW_41]
MKHLVIANWKMNPMSLKEAISLAKEEDKKDVVIIPPTPYIPALQTVVKKGSLGVQDVDPINAVNGPYTSALSPAFLKKFGVRYTIIGHSEARANLGESDAIIAHKIKSALDAGIIPILCVGETKEVRDMGYTKAREFVLDQLERGLDLIKGGVGKIIIAYEPVWAISTNNEGVADDSEGAGEMIQNIKAHLSSSMKLWAQYKIIGVYGGSVGVNNVGVFLKERSIDGFLVGSASLRSKEFLRIVEIVNG